MALPLAAAPAAAHLLIQVDKSTQQMTVSEDGRFLYRWPVSTGVARYDTPSGDFKPFRMEKDHFSAEWDDAPMPYSIFFTKKGHAIHGTNHKSIGRPASHGCVRLSVKHAAMLWKLVKQEKMANTEVVLTGRMPGAAPVVAGGARQAAPLPPPEDVTASVAQRYQRRWNNDGFFGDNGRYDDDDQPPLPPPGYVPDRRDRATTTAAMTTARCRSRSFCSGNSARERRASMIRKLAGGKYRLYSRKKNPKTGKRRNLGTFDSEEGGARSTSATCSISKGIERISFDRSSPRKRGPRTDTLAVLPSGFPLARE